jgi:transcriptional regulator with XRE-family HTH domain
MPHPPVTLPAATCTASLSRQHRMDGKGRGVGKSGVEAFDPQRLREARETAGLTQRDLAVRMLEASQAAKGSDPATLTGDAWARAVETERTRIISYEQGTHVPRAALLRRLADALGVDAFALFRPNTPRTLVTLRTRLGLTQADVAAVLSVGRAYYSRIEQGIASLTDPADLQALANLLRIDLNEARALMSTTVST